MRELIILVSQKVGFYDFDIQKMRETKFYEK